MDKIETIKRLKMAKGIKKDKQGLKTDLNRIKDYKKDG